MNPVLKKQMENTMVFLSSELSEANKRATLFHSALLASENLWKSTDQILRKSHPNLAYRLRVSRSEELQRKISMAHRTIGKLHDDITDLRRERRQLTLIIKDLENSAKGFLECDSRSSSRSLAAENTKLKAEIALLKMNKQRK